MIVWKHCRILRLLLSMLMSRSMSMSYLLCKLRFVLLIIVLYDLYALSVSLVIFGSKISDQKKNKRNSKHLFFVRKDVSEQNLKLFTIDAQSSPSLLKILLISPFKLFSQVVTAFKEWSWKYFHQNNFETGQYVFFP